MTSSSTLRATFNEDAERYNRFRPSYPKELFTKLLKEVSVTKASKVLEIGPGTGQATRPLAKIGCEITGIELGTELANKARDVLKDYSNVDIINESFESVKLSEHYYDLVISATAFHWVDDRFKYTKTAALLKPHGFLAVIHTEHVSDNKGDKFFFVSQPIYNKYMPSKDSERDKNFRLPDSSNLKALKIDESLFKVKSFSVFPTDITYSAEDYSGLLSTYSPVIALSTPKRQAFLADIQSLINEKFGGFLVKRLAFTLMIAEKK